MPFYEFEKINRYSKYISDTEDKLCYRTLEKLRSIFLNNGFKISNHVYSDTDGLKYSFRMANSEGNDFLFLVQGSFANATCIRQESDLDIAIISEGTFRGEYRPGKSAADYGFVNSSFNILDFKNKIRDILRNNGFNAKNGNKCINVDFNESNKKSFDLVPCLRYRDYRRDYYDNPNNYQYGILIRTSDGKERINYPEQSILNSTDKNKDTDFYYKKVVRILKNIKKDMEDDNIQIAKDISSFELECLIYNVPNRYFSKAINVDQAQQLKHISKQVVQFLLGVRENIRLFKETNEILGIYEDSSKDFNKSKQFILALYNYFN